MKLKIKPKTIVSLAVLAIFASLLLFSFGNQVGSYMSFQEAAVADARAHVVGEWVRPEETQYNPMTNVFSFYMRDDQGEERLVNYNNPKPASFEDAEKLVVEGRLEGRIFRADRILMKCPSKYNDIRALENAEMSEIVDP